MLLIGAAPDLDMAAPGSAVRVLVIRTLRLQHRARVLEVICGLKSVKID